MRKNKIVIVETSDAIESEARDVAESKLTASKEQLKGVKGFFQKIWKHNLFHEYYRQKEIHKAKHEITTQENIFANTNADKTAHNEAMKSIVTRFGSEYDETIHKEAGEKKELLKNEGIEGEIKEEVKNIIISFAQGNIDESIFIEEKNRIFSKIKGQKKDVIDKGAMYADNLLEVARQVKQNIEHGERLEDLDLDFDIVVGKAKAGVRTEAQFNLCDKIIHKITNTSVGRFVNETTVASAVAIGYSIATAASQRLANSSLFAWGSFGATAVLGAGIAGMREGRRLEEERRQHFRDMAKGKNFNPDEAPRRKQMEEFRYETVTASMLINNLNNEISKLSPANLEATLGHLAEIEARIKLSDTKKIDLISFSDEEKVEKERLNLDIARAQAKVAIKKFVADNAIPLPENLSFEDYLMKITETRSLDLTGGDTGIEKRNALFRKMKTKKVAWAAVKGLATGLVIGGISQEIGAFFKADQQGFVEGLIKGHQAPIGPVHHLTPLEYFRAYLAGDLNKIPTPSGFHEVLIGTNHIKLPNGVDLVKNTDGSYDLMHGKDFITKHLDFNKDGTLTEQVKNSLIKYGIPVHGSVQTITHQTTENITSNTPEYIKRHPELFNKIHRDLWYDNDTPAPVFDKNELGLWWGGNGNSGIDTHGNYVFNIKNMSSLGSYHDSFSVNAQDAMKSGKLVMMLSLSDGTQNMAVPVPIDINGNAIINPNSAIGKMFFSTVDGHALFKGKFAEVAQVLGVDKAGEKSLRILATHVGDGVNSVPDTIVKNIVEHIPRTALDIRFPAEQHALDAPWVIPVFGREPLEPITKPKSRKQSVMLPTFDQKPEINSYYNYLDYGQQNSYGSFGNSLIGDKNADVKQYFSNLESFKPIISETIIRQLANQGINEFEYIINSLDKIRKDQKTLDDLHKKYLNRYGGNISKKDFKDKIISTYQNMARNVLIEKSKVGEKPYNKDFYKKSPIINGIQKAEEIVIVFDPPLGDTVLDIPIFVSIQKYLSLNNLKKGIIIVTKFPELFEDFKYQYPEIKIFNYKDAQNKFSDRKKRYIVNDYKNFREPSIFGLSDDEFKDEHNVLNVHYSSWSLEQSPSEKVLKNKMTLQHHYPLPSRVMRNMELILGTKLFDNIQKINGYWAPVHEFKKRSENLRKKWNFGENDQILGISFGSSIVPKEYEPEKWVEVIKNFLKDADPNLKIVIIRDTDEAKAKKYEKEVIEKLPDDIRSRIIWEKVELKEIPLYMKMFKVFVSPDTGLGHIAASSGTPNVIIHINNPVLWSSAKSIRVMEKSAIRAYRKGERDYGEAWGSPDRFSSYYVQDRSGKLGGASLIPSKSIIDAIKRAIL